MVSESLSAESQLTKLFRPNPQRASLIIIYSDSVIFKHSRDYTVWDSVFKNPKFIRFTTLY